MVRFHYWYQWASDCTKNIESFPERSTDGSQDDPDQNLFATEIRNCAGSTVVLAVWNPKVCDDLKGPLGLDYLPLKHR